MSKKKIDHTLKLIKSGKEKKLIKAREILEEQLQIAIEEKNLELEIAARYQLGRALHALGDQETAFQYFRANIAKLESTPGYSRISRENMARVFRNRGEWDRAISILEELVINFRSAGHESRATATKLDIGHILHEIGQLEEARGVYEWCLKRSMDSGDGKGAFDALIAKAIIDFDIGDHFAVLAAVEKAKDLAESLSDTFRLTQAMKLRGLIAERKGAFNEADELYQQCEIILDALEKGRGQRFIQDEFKKILNEKHFDEAFRLYQDTQAFRQTIADISFKISIIQRRGEIQLALRQPKKAIEILKKGLEIAERIWDPHRICSLFEALARAELEFSLKEAETLVIRSLEISDDLHNPSMTANSQRTLGQIYKLKGDYPTARKHIEKAIEIRRSLGYQLELCQDLRALGELFHETGAFRDAENAFEEGMLIGERLDAKYEISLLLRSLGLLFYQRGILESAIAFLEEAKGYLDEVGVIDADVLLGLAKAHLDSGYRDQAQWFFELASAVAHERNESRAIAACRLLASSISASKGRLFDAEEIANVALQQSESINDFHLIVKSRLALASLTLRKAQDSLRPDSDADPFAFFNHVSKAGEYLDLCLESAKQAKLYPVFTEVLLIKCILDLMLSRFDNAKKMATQAFVSAEEHGLYGQSVRADRLLEKVEEMRQRPAEMAEYFSHIEELLRPRRA
ncbi:MAG: tetratricopeptide repeat protein [Candidatus Thorarchaeota archaeon]